MVVDFSWRSSDDEVADGISRELDVGEGAEDVDLLVGHDDSRASGVLNRILRLAILARDSTKGSGEVVPMEHLHVSHHEGVDVEVVQTEQGYCILKLEAHHECLHEILAFLNSPEIVGTVGGLELNTPRLRVEPNLQLEVLDDRTHQVLPLTPQRRQAMGRAADLPVLDLASEGGGGGSLEAYTCRSL